MSEISPDELPEVAAPSLREQYPNTIAGALQGLIGAVFGLLQVFDVYTLTAAQNGAVMTTYGAGVALWTAIVARKSPGAS